MQQGVVGAAGVQLGQYGADDFLLYQLAHSAQGFASFNGGQGIGVEGIEQLGQQVGIDALGGFVILVLRGAASRRLVCCGWPG